LYDLQRKQIKKDLNPSSLAHFHLIIMTKKLIDIVRLLKN